MILIVSKDNDFSSVIAQQVSRELGRACAVSETIEKAKGAPP